MRCEDFDDLIYLLWDGRIDERKKEELKKHLSTCERCKEKLALLESIEKGAKGIKIKEPSQEYWDTFSKRVRERIITRREESFSFKLKKAFENVFTFSPLKIKIAAGVVSIVLVFIVGKLYMDYRGKEIILSKPKMKSTEAPALYAPELKKGVSHMEVKVGKAENVVPLPDEFEKAESLQITPKETTTTGAPSEEKLRTKDKAIPPLDEAEKAVAPQVIYEEKTTPKVAESKEAISSIETYSTGAGAEKGESVLQSMNKAGTKEKRLTTIPPVEPETSQLLAYTLGFVKYYNVNNEKVLGLEEYYYLFLKEDELRNTINTWNKYIEKNPNDSLTNIGYLQVAIGYYLLSKLTKDESDLLKGIELLEKYEKEVTDTKTKEELNKKLNQLKALKEK